MRIHVLSDVHDDHQRAQSGHAWMPPRDVDADVTVVAGDIAGRLSRMGRSWLEGLPQGRPVVLVAGNHDFWTGSLDNEIAKFRDRLQSDDIFILDGEAVVIGDVRFVGATLWTDYEAYGDAWRSHRAANESMNDLRRIRTNSGSRRAETHDLLDEHLRQRAAIEAVLETPFAGPTVVVTHHAPSPRSLRHGRVTEALDGAYASDLEPLIRRTQPELWIHGHIHVARDYMIGHTRILANPVGYSRRFGQFVQREHDAFDPRLVIDVRPHPRPMPDPAPEPTIEPVVRVVPIPMPDLPSDDLEWSHDEDQAPADEPPDIDMRAEDGNTGPAPRK